METMVAQVIWGSIGFSYIMYSRKQKESIPLIVGIIICATPYILNSMLIISIINIILMFYPKFTK